MATRWIIGLSAGPGLDGVDAALLEVEDRGLAIAPRVRHCIFEAFPKDLRELLLRTATPEQADVRQISLAHRLMGESFAQAARQVADRATVSLQKVLCAGCLGLTAWLDGDGRYASNLDLGASAVVAERTGLTTLSDFRWRDLACGGQGTPIAALADRVLYHSSAEDRLILHLGAIAQVIYLPAGDDPRGVLGWDAGPCTILLDCLIRQLTNGKERTDSGGKHAVQGRQLPELLERWLNHPFLMKRPPKGLHRFAFAEEFARQTAAYARQMNWSFHDLLCTANHLVVRAIAGGIRQEAAKLRLPRRIVLSGRGAQNGLLWRLLQEQYPNIPIERGDALGVPAEAQEAVQAALLACFTTDGVPANASTATGAAGSRLLGSLTPGSTTNWSRCLAWMTGRTDLLEED